MIIDNLLGWITLLIIGLWLSLIVKKNNSNLNFLVWFSKFALCLRVFLSHSSSRNYPSVWFARFGAKESFLLHKSSLIALSDV